MFPERKKISVKHLKVGDLVVGMHVNKITTGTRIVAGKITTITTNNKSDDIIYHVKGDALTRPFEEPIILSGILEENEIEVIDPQMCLTIIELFNSANQKIIEGKNCREPAEKISKIRHKSRQELEEKYAVG